VTQQRGTDMPAPPDKVAERLRNPLGDVPNQRDGLPSGTLRELPADPQGDENRDPPRLPEPPP
jgi:hypothetical protein